MRKNKFIICFLVVLALLIAIPAAILADDTASETGTIPQYGGNIYNAGTVNISGGTVYGGFARYGGNIFNQKTGSLTVSGGAQVLDGVAYVLGGNVYAANGSTFNQGGLIGNSGSDYDGIYVNSHSTCICGSNSSSHAEGCDGDAMSIDWQEWTDSTSLPSESGYYYLTGNVTVTEIITLTNGQDIYLDLNGKTVFKNAGDAVYNLNSSTSNALTILDSVGTGRFQLCSSKATGAFIRVANNNTFTMYGGTIDGTLATHSSAATAGTVICIGASNAGGVVKIHGGTIIGGTSTSNGGAIGVNSGTLYMSAGEIYGGTAKLGGNLYLASGATAYIYGTASIHDGTATADGYADSGNIYLEDGATLAGQPDTDDDSSVSDDVYVDGSVLSVGYGKAAITPTTAVMTGEGTAVTTENINDIYAISVYMTDTQGNEYLHVVVDLSWGGLKDSATGVDGIGDQVRSIAADMGFDSSYVTVGGTHTHTGVVYGSQDSATLAWRENELREGVIASIKAAVADCAPATMYTGSTETDGYTWVRRYTTTDSSYNGYWDGFNAISATTPSGLKHETEADEQIQLIKFVREEGKDIVMVNWQTHATMADGNAIISSDFVGALRDTVANTLGVNCVFYQGACGNLAPTSRISGESKITNGSQAAADALGQAVAAYVTAFDDYNQVATGGIQINQQKISSASSKVTDETVIANANLVYNYRSSHDLYETNQYAWSLGLQSYYEAKAIIEHSGSFPVNKTYEINTITIGDVAFVTLPMELSDVIGMEIKNNSKFNTTMLLGYTCGTGEYLMHEAAYENGGYETYNTYFAKGTAEQLRDQYLNQLDEFYTSRY